MSDMKDRVETLRDQLEDGERGGPDADCEALLTFSNRLRLMGSEYTEHRHTQKCEQ